MMKLGLLVLVLTGSSGSVSKGLNQTLQPTNGSTDSTSLTPANPRWLSEVQTETNNTTQPPLSPEQTASTAIVTGPSGETTGNGDEDEDKTTEDKTGYTHSTTPYQMKVDVPTSTPDYVILVFILLVILILITILFLLRRASRTYSFDLQRPPAVSHPSQATGTFEPVDLDDLDRAAAHGEETVPPTANGATPQSDDDARQGKMDANGGMTSPSSETNEPADEQLDMNLLSEVIGVENENINNPSFCSGDPFVEINLNEPSPYDQLAQAAEAPPSARPPSPASSSKQRH
ncbi:uncharacterized protein ACBR49_018954 isoform 2-T2 [Aulostomus maculatus]